MGLGEKEYQKAREGGSLVTVDTVLLQFLKYQPECVPCMQAVYLRILRMMFPSLQQFQYPHWFQQPFVTHLRTNPARKRTRLKNSTRSLAHARSVRVVMQYSSNSAQTCYLSSRLKRKC